MSPRTPGSTASSPAAPPTRSGSHLLLLQQVSITCMCRWVGWSPRPRAAQGSAGTDGNMEHPPACKVGTSNAPPPPRHGQPGQVLPLARPVRGRGLQRSPRKAGSRPQRPRPTGARGRRGHVGLVGILVSAPCGAWPPQPSGGCVDHTLRPTQPGLLASQTGHRSSHVTWVSTLVPTGPWKASRWHLCPQP